MSKSDKNLVALAAIGVGTILIFAWLESNPNCDRGCRTQLDHLRDHILKEIITAAVPQLGPFLG